METYRGSIPPPRRFRTIPPTHLLGLNNTCFFLGDTSRGLFCGGGGQKHLTKQESSLCLPTHPTRLNDLQNKARLLQVHTHGQLHFWGAAKSYRSLSFVKKNVGVDGVVPAWVQHFILQLYKPCWGEGGVDIFWGRGQNLGLSFKKPCEHRPRGCGDLG